MRSTSIPLTSYLKRTWQCNQQTTDYTESTIAYRQPKFIHVDTTYHGYIKTIKKNICERLYCHLNDNNILVHEQFGFREKSSTEMATYEFLNNVLSSLDKKNLGGLFCDLKKHLIALTMTYFWPK